MAGRQHWFDRLFFCFSNVQNVHRHHHPILKPPPPNHQLMFAIRSVIRHFRHFYLFIVENTHWIDWINQSIDQLIINSSKSINVVYFNCFDLSLKNHHINNGIIIIIIIIMILLLKEIVCVCVCSADCRLPDKKIYLIS